MKGYTEIYFEDENAKEFKEYKVEVSFEYYYDSGRNYMPNGDPGYPGYESLDFKIENETEVPDWITDEMIEDRLVEDLPGLLEVDEPEYEPEDDDWRR